MKNIIIGITFFMIVLGSIFGLVKPAYAYSSEAYFTFDYSTKTITSYSGPGGVVDIPPTISGIPVLRIGDSAFNRSVNRFTITNITIPDGVISIGVDSFRECEKLTSISLPNTISSIGSYAFAYCRSIAKINIPNSVTSIGSGVFCGCNSLTDLPANLPSIGDSMFEYCSSLSNITIPNNISVIGSGAFISCSKITGVTIPSSIKTIGVRAFAWCGALSDIVLPDSVTIIGGDAFRACSKLTNIKLSSSISNIPSGTFSDCSNLTNITIPKSITNIEVGAFSGCLNLANVNVDVMNLVYTSQNGVLYSHDRTKLVFYPYGKATDFIVPDNVTNIGDYAFWACGNLTSIVIPNSVKSIGNSAFSYCSKLNSVILSNSITSIGSEAFRESGLTSIKIPSSISNISLAAFLDCRNLVSATIENNVKSISDLSFGGCINLTRIDIPISVTSISNLAFDRCPNIKIYGFASSYAEQFANIKGISFITIYYSLSKNYVTMNLGEFTAINLVVEQTNVINSVKWCSTDTNVATVDSSGRITAVSEGACEVFPYIGDNILDKASCYVRVRKDKTEISTLDYLAFSHIVYTDFTKYDYVYNILDETKEGNKFIWNAFDFTNFASSVEWKDFYKYTIGNWKLVGFMENGQFYAALFKNEDTNQTVISYRGTDSIPTEGVLDDFVGLMSTDATFGQFKDALDFYNIAVNAGYTNITLTGHSLGGALANYVSMRKNIVSRTVNSLSSSAGTYYGYYKNIDFSGIDTLNYIDYINIKDSLGNQGNDIDPTIIYDTNADPLPFYTHSIKSLIKFTNNEYKFELTPKNNEKYLNKSPLYYYRPLSLNPILVLGSSKSETLTGLLNGIRGNLILAGDGNDQLIGAKCNDIFIGGKGSDTISDDSGHDTYIFGLDDGNDYIYDKSGWDTILFKDGITPSMIEATDSGPDGLWYSIKIKNHSTSIMISKQREFWLSNSFKLEFADGTIVPIQDWNSKAWKEKIYKAACPITLQVLDSNNNVVASINEENPEPQNYDFGYLYVTEENGEKVKVVHIFDDNYKVKIIGTGIGTMKYSITEDNSEGLTSIATFENVPITPTTVISDSKSENYMLNIDENGDGIVDKIIKPIKEDKSAPVITIGDYTKEPTKQSISVTASTNKGTLNASSHLFTENGSFEFVATDDNGNVTRKIVTITNIIKNEVNDTTVCLQQSAAVITKVVITNSDVPFSLTPVTLGLSITYKDKTIQIPDNTLATWNSSDPSVASVDYKGVVTFTGISGSTRISAQIGSKRIDKLVTVKCTLTANSDVLANPSSTTAQAITVTADYGNGITQTLNPRLFTWRSSNNSIATVDAKGNISCTGRPGNVSITGTMSKMKVVLTATLTSQLSISGITNYTIEPTSITTTMLFGTTTPIINSNSVIYSSSNTNVAKVDSVGNVTFTGKVGNVKITARYLGMTTTQAITISAKCSVPQTLAYSSTPQQLAIFADYGTGTTYEVSNSNIVWRSLNTKVATVNASGVVTYTGVNGDLKITATVFGQTITIAAAISK